MNKDRLIIALLVFAGCSGPKEASREAPTSLPERSPGQVISESSADEWAVIDPEFTLYLEIPQGRIVIALSEDLADGHVKQIKALAREEYFDGLHFYRVVEGFVAQGGDAEGERVIRTAADSLVAEFDEALHTGLDFTPLGNADGYAEEAGFVNGFPAGRSQSEDKVWLTHCAGAMAFARGGSKNSASATFYFTLQPQRYLDRNLTVVGRVIWGMENLQSITRGKPGNGGTIENDSDWTKIESIRVAADLPAER